MGTEYREIVYIGHIDKRVALCTGNVCGEIDKKHNYLVVIVLFLLYCQIHRVVFFVSKRGRKSI